MATEVDLNQVFDIAQFGLLGAVFLAILAKKWLVPAWTLTDLKTAHDRELAVKDEIIAGLRQDVNELKALNGEMQALTREKLIPALVESTSTNREYVAVLARRGTSDAP